MVHAEEPSAGHLHVLLPDPPVHARLVPGHPLTASLDELELADEAARWSALGFVVDGAGQLDVGTVRLRFEAPSGSGDGRGILGWSLRGVVDSSSIDGLRTTRSSAPQRAAAPAHPNGAIGLDHVVVATPDFERTLAALDTAGLELRRVREAGPAKQGFFRVGEAVLEVVGPGETDGAGPATFWGVVVVVDDLEAAAAHMGDLLGNPRDAVQPGRQIATVSRDGGLACQLALMTPAPPHD